MFGFYNLKRNFYADKRSYFIVIAIFFAGFIFGSCYSNFTNDDTFLKSMRSMDGYLQGKNSFNYSFNDEFSLMGIFFGGFFILGKAIVSFFIFKSGFMLGYFVSFLIKGYELKGMLAGLSYLLLSLVLCFPWQLFLSSYAFDCCTYTTDCLFRKKPCVVNLKSFLCFFALFFFLCLIFTFCGNFLRTKLFSKIIAKIFA